MAPPPDSDSVLAGVVVVERGRRLATAAVGHLLASLGATVLRLEMPAEAQRLDSAPLGERVLCCAGKRRLATAGDADWTRWTEGADVLLLDPMDAEELPRLRALATVRNKVVCIVTPSGLESEELWLDAPEPLLQALAGALGVTGEENGAPAFTQVPIAELSAALVATTSVLAALRVRQRDGVSQLIDFSLIEAASDHLRLHLPLLSAPEPKQFRQGCRHPICAPWNVYRTRDGWVLICSTSDAQWHALLGAIDRPEMRSDPRFSSAFTRRANADAVDGLVQDWTATRSARDVVAAVDAAGVPAGEVRSIPQVLQHDVLRRRGTVRDAGLEHPVFGTAIGLRRTPVSTALPAGPDATHCESWPASTRQPAARNNRPEHARPPLAGIRVVEITRYTAGPLAGMLLAGLGAEVIKIESPGGEEARRWQPQHDGVSGYFINHNAGKRSVTLDLRQAADQQQLARLVADSDVLLQNLRPGVMDKIGLGAQRATERHKRLVHATISGFGLDGPEVPALDTVIQGAGGLPSLVGSGEPPCRVGFSIADQVSGHLTALTILAAIIERDRSGQGQIVDIAMCDAIAWLTQLAWPHGKAAIGACSIWQASDGWVAAAADASAIQGSIRPSHQQTRADLVAAFELAGIRAAPMLEPAEVFAQPLFATRKSIFDVLSGASPAPVLTLPFGLTVTPALRPARMHSLGEDNAALLSPQAMEPSDA